MQRETYRQGIRQKQQKFLNKKIKPAQKCRLHWKLQNAAKMKVDLFPWQHFSGRLLSAGERTKCTQFPSLGHRCIQPAPSFSAPPTNNIVSVSMIISLLYITISYIIYQATTNQQHCQCRWYQHQLQHYYRHIHISVWCRVWWWSDENVWRL